MTSALCTLCSSSKPGHTFFPLPLPTLNGWLSLAIYGLPTRLLDWSDSLLVAAWFAVEKGGAKEHDSAIWVTWKVPYADIDAKIDLLALKKPLCYRPPQISRRMSAQGSVLMVCPKPTVEVALPVVKKIIIKRTAEFTLKKRINSCGINRRHLYPDLVGLSEHLEWLYKNDWLAGYRKKGNVIDDEQVENI